MVLILLIGVNGLLSLIKSLLMSGNDLKYKIKAMGWSILTEIKKVDGRNYHINKP